jgi:CO/xanthine dehydrogenase FAD-binding subunit
VVASEVHYPATVLELLDLLRRDPGLLIFAGGTEILREQGSRYVDLPPVVALVDRLQELRAVTLTERYIDIGAGLTMAEILGLKAGTLPAPFAETVAGIATPSVRNLATLGGNLATRRHFMDTWAVLACLESLIELRDGAGVRWVNVNRLVDSESRPSFPVGSLITRIRVSLEPWTRSIVKKVGNRSWPARDSGLFVVVAREAKGLVSAFRLAYAGEQALRFPEIEGRVVGARLPLGTREQEALLEAYRAVAAAIAPEMAGRFGALVEMALEDLST